uniref:Uncharacterized protein n=1 Tax=Oryza brachyantha TaxID=4533 RepID=J3MUU8_ORYBR
MILKDLISFSLKGLHRRTLGQMKRMLLCIKIFSATDLQKMNRKSDMYTQFCSLHF